MDGLGVDSERAGVFERVTYRWVRGMEMEMMAVCWRIGFGESMYIPPGLLSLLGQKAQETNQRFGSTRIHSDR
jgi:hypothetical protein